METTGFFTRYFSRRLSGYHRERLAYTLASLSPQLRKDIGWPAIDTAAEGGPERIRRREAKPDMSLN